VFDDFHDFKIFVRNRIKQLRTDRGFSARDMSLSMGQNDAYINHIENPKNDTMPSMEGLYLICEFFRMEAGEFFEQNNAHSEIMQEIFRDIKKLDENTLRQVRQFIKRL